MGTGDKGAEFETKIENDLAATEGNLYYNKKCASSIVNRT